MRKNRKNLWKTVSFALAVMTLLLLLLSVILAIKLASGHGAENSGALPVESVSEASDTESLRAELEQVRAEKEKLESEISAGGADISGIISELLDKDSRIAELENSLSLVSSGYAGDYKKQAELFSRLADLVASPPRIAYETEIETETENGTVSRTLTLERAPKLSLCYLDIETGYTFSFAGDLEFDSASVVKAPYSLGILSAASEEYEARQREIAGGASEDQLGAPVYDFSKEIIYTYDEYYKPGSGVIAGLGEGKKYTYSELFGYLLSDSDNVAFGILTSEYGHDRLHSLVRDNGWSSMSGTTRNMSAKDGCDIMKKIYEFTESGAKYAALMKNSLTGSDQRDLIMSVADGRAVAHKYGWDVGAYHDIGIVYDEHPYTVAIFSDYDNAESEQVAYMQSLLRAVDAIHKEFHSHT